MRPVIELKGLTKDLAKTQGVGALTGPIERGVYRAFQLTGQRSTAIYAGPHDCR
jgi:hypothetical protein